MAKITMTQKMALDNAINYILGNEMPENWNIDETIEKLESMRTQLNKKASSKASKIDAKLVAQVLENMVEVDEPMTVGGMIENFVCLSGMKSQKVTPIVTKLVKDGKLDVVTVKGRNHYVLAE